VELRVSYLSSVVVWGDGGSNINECSSVVRIVRFRMWIKSKRMQQPQRYTHFRLLISHISDVD
jgi:hypothetical protein